MKLRDINYEHDYRSGAHDILNEFFRPALRAAKRYWRAVGYFSSSAFESFGAPLSEFVRTGGEIRLITSVELTAEDVRAIEEGLSKKEVSEKRIERIIEEQFSREVTDGTAALVGLLKVGRLQIKIAIPRQGFGIYHEKVGVFFDDEDYVAFSGSSNESRQAFEGNYECIDVFPSWESPSRSNRKLTHFQDLWENHDPGAEVMLFPQAAKEKLLRVYAQKAGEPGPPVHSASWTHQTEALTAFLAKERGVLNMATGTGKTRTAIEIVKYLIEGKHIDSVVVTTDGNDLLDQWYRNVLFELKNSEPRFRIYCHYENNKELNEYLLSPTNALLLCSRSFVSSALRGLRGDLHSRLLLIHDEVHGLGSPGNRKALSGLSANVRYRLGLSATPERDYDAEGTAFIAEHIGPVIFEFGLEDAISRRILAPFDYVPLGYRLTADDRQRLANVYKRQAARTAAGNPMSDEEVWIEVAKVYKTSRAKLPIFQSYVATNAAVLRRCIVFVETQQYGEEVLDIIHKHHADFHTYFSGEDSETLRRFAQGDLECLITCHRLSEGIDIRSLSNVVLFSSAKTRLETIQRIGRCLRRDPADAGKIATVLDFVRAQEKDTDEPNADIERSEWLAALSKVRPI